MSTNDNSDIRGFHGPEAIVFEADDTALAEFAEEWTPEDEFPSESDAQMRTVASIATALARPMPPTPTLASRRSRWLGLAAIVAIVAVLIVYSKRTTPAPLASSSLPLPIAAPSLHVPRAPDSPVALIEPALIERATSPPLVTVVPSTLPRPILRIRPRAEPTPLPEPPAPPASAPRADLPAAPARLAAAITARPAEVAGTRVTDLVQDQSAIHGLLDAYRNSYSRLDAVSAATLWPGVDTAALTRAFATLASQDVEFASCSVQVQSQRATADCNGSVRYVRRVGNPAPQTRALAWSFDLDRRSGRWLITRVTAK